MHSFLSTLTHTYGPSENQILKFKYLLFGCVIGGRAIWSAIKRKVVADHVRSHPGPVSAAANAVSVSPINAPALAEHGSVTH